MQLNKDSATLMLPWNKSKKTSDSCNSFSAKFAPGRMQQISATLMPLKKKAQFSSIDLVMAIFIFMLIIVALFYNYDSLGKKVSSTELEQDMGLILTYATESLISTDGLPTNWNLVSDFNTSSVYALGLANSPNVLSEDKINFLISINDTDYEDVKTILGVLGPGYEFGFDYYKHNGTDYELNETFGNHNTSASKVLVSQRNFVLDDLTTLAYMRFYLTK